MEEFYKNFLPELEKVRKDKQLYETSMNTMKKEDQTISDELSRAVVTLGVLENTKKKFDQNLSEMSADIYRLAQKYNIAGYESSPYSGQQYV